MCMCQLGVVSVHSFVAVGKSKDYWILAKIAQFDPILVRSLENVCVEKTKLMMPKNLWHRRP